MLQILASLASLLFATTTATPYDALKREAEKFVEEKASALAWWSGRSAVGSARSGYLSIFRRLDSERRYGYRNQLPPAVLVNLISLATHPHAAMHPRFVLPQQLLGEGRHDRIDRPAEQLA